MNLQSQRLDGPWNPELTKFLCESNQIEGVHIDPVWIEMYVRNPEQPVMSIEMRHAQNSVKAMLYAFTKHQEKLHLRILFEIHARAMRDLLQFPGMYRTTSVKVGGNLCPPAQEVPRLMEHWFDLYNAAPGVAPGWNPLRLHYEFELIHPFHDGNGRVGRILWMMDRMRRGQLVQPILETFERKEATFLAKRDLYYDALELHRAMKARKIQEMKEALT